VGKLRANQIRALERRTQLRMRSAKPGYEAIKAHTIELPMAYSPAPPGGWGPVVDVIWSVVAVMRIMLL
jgi:hypothetical protein